MRVRSVRPEEGFVVLCLMLAGMWGISGWLRPRRALAAHRSEPAPDRPPEPAPAPERRSDSALAAAHRASTAHDRPESALTIEPRRESTPPTEADAAAGGTEAAGAGDAASAWDAERHRIVRDLHDVVTHQVAAMIVQAEAARYLSGTPERLDAALTAVTDTGRRAIADLRYLYGLLAYDPGPGRAAVGEATRGALTSAAQNAETAVIPPQPAAPDAAGTSGAAGPSSTGTFGTATPGAIGRPGTAGPGGTGMPDPDSTGMSGSGFIGMPGAAGMSGPGFTGRPGAAGIPGAAGAGTVMAAESVGLGAAVVSSDRAGGLEIGAPCDGDLHALVEEMRRAGQPVEFAEAGQAAPSSRAAELVAYRVIQAALVDALRYAPGSRTSVEVRHGVREVTLRVRTDGAVFHAATGQDLAGVRARVEALGGEFHQERRPDGTFVITAVIPATLPE